jgi:hypothetical protein
MPSRTILKPVRQYAWEEGERNGGCHRQGSPSGNGATCPFKRSPLDRGANVREGALTVAFARTPARCSADLMRRTCPIPTKWRNSGDKVVAGGSRLPL